MPKKVLLCLFNFIIILPKQGLHFYLHKVLGRLIFSIKISNKEHAILPVNINTISILRFWHWLILNYYSPWKHIYFFFFSIIINCLSCSIIGFFLKFKLCMFYINLLCRNNYITAINIYTFLFKMVFKIYNFYKNVALLFCG